MANDADACVPQTLTDFVFDLYDSVTTSQLMEEQSKFYNVDFRDLSAKVSVLRFQPLKAERGLLTSISNVAHMHVMLFSKPFFVVLCFLSLAVSGIDCLGMQWRSPLFGPL
jgi:hypothetical protein